MEIDAVSLLINSRILDLQKNLEALIAQHQIEPIDNFNRLAYAIQANINFNKKLILANCSEMKH